MDRSEWLKKTRTMAEALYDHGAEAYWVKFAREIESTHRDFIGKFLSRLQAPGMVLDAACGAGLYDETLLQAGHRVLGIDQSGGVLERARQHYPSERFPGLRYEKRGLQEMDFQAEFDGIICMDAMEHICPEDWLLILRRFHQALKPGGVLYLTVGTRKGNEFDQAYADAKAKGLPVVYGEDVYELDDAYAEAMSQDLSQPGGISGERLDHTVYHFYPSDQQVHDWYTQAGFTIDEEFQASGYMEEYLHILASK